ncbi:MAG TPA: hypothetical protein VIS54_01680 [Psychromonas sp.]
MKIEKTDPSKVLLAVAGYFDYKKSSASILTVLSTNYCKMQNQGCPGTPEQEAPYEHGYRFYSAATGKMIEVSC